MENKKFFTIIGVLIFSSFISACSANTSQQNAIPNFSNETMTPYETNLGDPMFEGITEEMAKAARPASEMTKNEFLLLSLDELRAFAMSQVPNFRSFLGVENDYVVTEDKWESARYVLCFQYYGSMRPDYVPEEESSVSDEELDNINIEDYIHDEIPEELLYRYKVTAEEVAILDKTPDEFDAMSDEEIAAAGKIYYKLLLVGDEYDMEIDPNDTEEIAFLRDQFSECYENTTFLKTLFAQLEALNYADL